MGYTETGYIAPEVAHMSFSTAIWYYLWIAPHVFQIGIVYLMMKHKHIRSYPWFYSYTVFEILEFATLFFFSQIHPIRLADYFRLYSISYAASTALRFCIILEVLRQLIQKYAVLRQAIKPLFRWAGVGLLIAALALAIYSGGDRSDRSWFVLNMLNRTALITQTGLLAGLLLFSRYFTLSWRNSLLGIGLGLGIYAFVDLIGAAVRSQTGFTHTKALDWVSMAAYQVSVLIWLFYLLAPEREQANVQELPATHEVEVWNQELERLLHQR